MEKKGGKMELTKEQIEKKIKIKQEALEELYKTYDDLKVKIENLERVLAILEGLREYVDENPPSQ